MTPLMFALNSSISAARSFSSKFENFLHVGLQVCGEAFLVAETGFNQLVVKDNINTGNGRFISTIILTLGIFRGVGSSKNNLSFLASFVLADDFPHHIVLQSHWVGVGEQFITGENILEDLHVEFAKKFLNLN